MDVVLILLLAVVVKGLCVRGKDDPDYMSPANTLSVKGLFVILVILSHFSAYTMPPVSDVYTRLKSHLGQCVVVMFLFYSGFGMMEQMKRKGYAYVRTVPRRFLTLLINFDIAVMLYGLLQLAFGNTFSPTSYLLSLTGWDSLGNSNWYIFDVLCLYALTYLCFHPLRREGKGSLYLSTGLMLAGSAALVVLIRAAGKEGWWYNTLLTFPLGMIFSLLRPLVERITRRRWEYLAACCLTALAYTFFSIRRGQSLSCYTLWTFLFAAAVVLLTMKLQLRSPLLDYAGRHVFSIYVLQRLPMMCLRHAGLLQSNPWLSLIITVLVTVLLAEIFDFLTGRLASHIFERKNHGA